MQDIICLMALVYSVKQGIVAQGTTVVILAPVQRIVRRVRPVVHLAQTVQPVITVGMAIRCMILFMNVIRTFRIRHRMVLVPKTAIIPVVQAPARFMRGIRMRGVIRKK